MVECRCAAVRSAARDGGPLLLALHECRRGALGVVARPELPRPVESPAVPSTRVADSARLLAAGGDRGPGDGVPDLRRDMDLEHVVAEPELTVQTLAPAPQATIDVNA